MLSHRPPSRPWIWFDKLGKQYDSPLIYLNLFGQDVVVVNDYQAAVELVSSHTYAYLTHTPTSRPIPQLEKRSGNYSSRPRLVVANEYALASHMDTRHWLVNPFSHSYGSSNKRLVFLPYGDQWRQHRAAFHRDTSPQKSLSYIPIQTAETKLIMRDILRSPAKFMDHFRRYSANVVLKSTWSRVTLREDWLLTGTMALFKSAMGWARKVETKKL